MAKYFSKFPKVYYSFNGNSVDLLTNVTVRFTLEQTLKENSVAYYNYVIKEGDTPEIIASKIYGSPERHWLILLMNDILDVEEQWPLQYNTLNRFIEKKYSQPKYADTANTSISGIVWAQQNTHSYYKVKTTTNNDEFTNRQIFEIDEESYSNTNAQNFVIPETIVKTLNDGNTITTKITKETKNYYDYEIELNESKRLIKILKNEFVISLEQELENLFDE
jgi:hypothetical protein